MLQVSSSSAIAIEGTTALTVKVTHITCHLWYGVRASTSSNLVIVPHAPFALFENSFAWRSPAIWNALPEHIRKYNNLHTFKKALRAHVMM